MNSTSESKIHPENGPHISDSTSPVIFKRCEDISKDEKVTRHFPMRLVISILAIMCPALCYFGRQNLSFAINAMVKDPKETQDGNDEDIIVDEAIITYGDKYDWSPADKFLMIGAFFWTYTFCQVPGSRVTELFGSTYVLLVATIGSSILNAISPWSASVGLYAFFIVRFLMGICQAALFPSCYNLLTHWLPVKERLLVFPILNFSSYLGAIVAIVASNYFSRHPQFGWPYAYYAPACLLAVWSILWILFGSSHPKSNKFISSAELEYIEKNRGDIRSDMDEKYIDWLKLARSRQIWAFIFSYFSSNWAFSLIMQLLPTYCQKFLKISPETNTTINVWIYAAYCFATPFTGGLAGFLVRKRPPWLKTIYIRMVFQSMGVFSQVLGFLLLIQAGKDVYKVQIILYSQIVLYSFVNGGEIHIPSEISVTFGGTIYGIANSIGSSTGFIVPGLGGLIVTDESDVKQWSTFLYFGAGATFVGGIIFLIIGGNEPENFAKQSINQSGVDLEIIEVTHLQSDSTSKMELDILRNGSKCYDSCEENHTDKREVNSRL